METLMGRAKKLEAAGVFLGGPAKLFSTAGQKQLTTLLSMGLTPDSKVLDIGCGCLRGGYWLIHLLENGNYFGIEPNIEMLEAGIQILLEPGLTDLKNPTFDNNTTFDFAVFGEKFDFFVARSIWTHASKQQIESMLDGFVSTANPRAIFLASYRRASFFKKDYQGTEWVGISHDSDKPGMVHHRFEWIQKACTVRQLAAEEIHGEAYNFGNQTWIKIKHKPV